jgi:hypothetical protein
MRGATEEEKEEKRWRTETGNTEIDRSRNKNHRAYPDHEECCQDGQDETGWEAGPMQLDQGRPDFSPQARTGKPDQQELPDERHKNDAE